MLLTFLGISLSSVNKKHSKIIYILTLPSDPVYGVMYQQQMKNSAQDSFQSEFCYLGINTNRTSEHLEIILLKLRSSSRETSISAVPQPLFLGQNFLF